LIVVTARAAALRIIAARQAGCAPVQTGYTLAHYQAEGVAQARAIMQRRRGVILADDVGLGKTYMAAALIEDELRNAGTPLIVVPAGMRSTWLRVLRTVLDPARVRIVSHTQLSRGYVIEPATLIVVDEAHAFRNPGTRRYRQLRRSCGSARVLLLTATPINNSLLDLYFQIRLYAADDAFKDLGIGSLKHLLGADPDRGALARLQREAIIRRTRTDLSAGLDCPQQVAIHAFRVPPSPTLDKISQLIDGLTFECYDQELTRVLVKLGLLKRLQSGKAAGLRSLDRLIALHRDCIAALAAGRLLRPHLRAPGSEDGQLSMLEVLLPQLPARFPATRYKMSLDRDLQLLQRARQQLAAMRDVKLNLLLDLLTARPPPARTIVFTEFRDSAIALWRELRFLRRAVITSQDSFLGDQLATREEILHRFAPRANCAPEPQPAEAVHVLIATDVMAEGLNLQDASAVISYDLPWNPVRLIQRAGRIDRLGSPHQRIEIFNLLPADELDGLLRIVQRLQSKLFALRSALRHQKAVLEATESMADKPADRLSGMLGPASRRTWDVDLAGAGPVGCAGSASLNAQRVLLSYTRNSMVRELIFADGRVEAAAPEAADEVLVAALDSCFVGEADLLGPAIAAGYRLLAAESLAGSADPQIEVLGRAIRQAVARLGFLAPYSLVERAETALAGLSGYLGPGALRAAQLRAGITPGEIEGVLERIIAECGAQPIPTEEAWQLIAAAAAD
jgi:hypothetical protein